MERLFFSNIAVEKLKVNKSLMRHAKKGGKVEHDAETCNTLPVIYKYYAPQSDEVSHIMIYVMK